VSHAEAPHVIEEDTKYGKTLAPGSMKMASVLHIRHTPSETMTLSLQG